MDEATAAVDGETDQLIQTAMRNVFYDCTVLTIAHRIDTVIDSNRVLVLARGGRIAEFDSPVNLLRRAGVHPSYLLQDFIRIVLSLRKSFSTYRSEIVLRKRTR